MSEASQQKPAPPRLEIGLLVASLVALAIVVFLWMRASGERDDLRDELDECQRRLETQRASVAGEDGLRQQLEAAVRESEEARKLAEDERTRAEAERMRAEEAQRLAEQAATGACPDKPLVVEKDCPEPRTRVVRDRNPKGDECCAELASERRLRQTCERELNSELREEIR